MVKRKTKFLSNYSWVSYYAYLIYMLSNACLRYQKNTTFRDFSLVTKKPILKNHHMLIKKRLISTDNKNYQYGSYFFKLKTYTKQLFIFLKSRTNNNDRLQTKTTLKIKLRVLNYIPTKYNNMNTLMEQVRQIRTRRMWRIIQM